MTRFGAPGYLRLDSGGRAIPELAQQPNHSPSDAETVSDIERLQQAVLELVARYRALRAENEGLRALVQERDERLRELNQRRQEALKRIDGLVAQIDEIDERLESSETSA